ncbi:MAG: LUD domain-containing protein [Meiothermus sp.]|uniref:LutC/YkgG family protein n=1 Tax=Meiothermus sp. TaxID=1955249 RepID=UPI0025EB11F7|nr:lactate utilization protein [Meiothermus sp.]MCS7069317.1 lactate utilization protein [Meiothermus sp.]MDW8426604.1 LUD domain-containing protein [Meiothermus sp.]
MRERILGRIHRALEHRPKAALPEPLAAPGLPTTEALALFTERLSGNGGEVVRLENLEAAQEWLGHFAQTFAGVAVGLNVPELLHPRLPQLPPEEAPLGISWALGAVAETGTVLLGSQEGRRTQLLPPTHLVFVLEARIYPSLFEALCALKPSLPSAIGLHSGPSKSADIGQIMVKGVHGPGRLVVGVISQ